MPLDKHPEDCSVPDFGKPKFPEVPTNLGTALNTLSPDVRIGVQIELGRGADLSTALRNVKGSVGQAVDNK